MGNECFLLGEEHQVLRISSEINLREAECKKYRRAEGE